MRCAQCYVDDRYDEAFTAENAEHAERGSRVE